MSTATKAEQAVALAALILADNSIPITADKIQTILTAAGVDDVEPIWSTLFTKALAGTNVKEILTTVQAGAPALGGAQVIEQPNDNDGDKPEMGEKDEGGKKEGDEGEESDDGEGMFDLFG
jgi:large subunit ribosomal protein LP1